MELIFIEYAANLSQLAGRYMVCTGRAKNHGSSAKVSWKKRLTLFHLRLRFWKKKKIEFENPSGSRVLAGNFELWNRCFGIFKRGRCHDLFVVVVAILSSWYRLLLSFTFNLGSSIKRNKIRFYFLFSKIILLIMCVYTNPFIRILKSYIKHDN